MTVQKGFLLEVVEVVMTGSDGGDRKGGGGGNGDKGGGIGDKRGGRKDGLCSNSGNSDGRIGGGVDNYNSDARDDNNSNEGNDGGSFTHHSSEAQQNVSVVMGTLWGGRRNGGRKKNTRNQNKWHLNRDEEQEKIPRE